MAGSGGASGSFSKRIGSSLDEGLWEVARAAPPFRAHSKVMAWVAFDRAIKDAEQDGLEGPIERWREVRDDIHAQVCEKGFDSRRNSFVQS